MRAAEAALQWGASLDPSFARDYGLPANCGSPAVGRVWARLARGIAPPVTLFSVLEQLELRGPSLYECFIVYFYSYRSERTARTEALKVNGSVAA
jgi:hypothetical protein